MFKFAKRMVKANQDIVGKQCIRNDDALTVSDEDKQISQKIYHDKLMNTEFACDRNSLSQTDS